MVALLSSFLVVALAEMGDKTQLVALSMASRYRRRWAVLLGILIATTVNHALASSVGVWAATRMPAAVVQWVSLSASSGSGSPLASMDEHDCVRAPKQFSKNAQHRPTRGRPPKK